MNFKNLALNKTKPLTNVNVAIGTMIYLGLVLNVATTNTYPTNQLTLATASSIRDIYKTLRNEPQPINGLDQLRMQQALGPLVSNFEKDAALYVDHINDISLIGFAPAVALALVSPVVILALAAQIKEHQNSLVLLANAIFMAVSLNMKTIANIEAELTQNFLQEQSSLFQDSVDADSFPETTTFLDSFGSALEDVEISRNDTSYMYEMVNCLLFCGLIANAIIMSLPSKEKQD